jgi:hypothetical protein
MKRDRRLDTTEEKKRKKKKKKKSTPNPAANAFARPGNISTAV